MAFEFYLPACAACVQAAQAEDEFMVINGKKIAEKILNEARELLKARKKPLRLAMVYVAGNPESKKYLGMKKAAGNKIGIKSRIYEVKRDITTQNFRKKIVKIAKSNVNQGVIVELPFPKHINAQYVLNALPEKKDPDVLSQKAQGAFFVGRSRVLPPSVQTMKVIFDHYNITPEGKKCAVFGYGMLIGRPIAHWLAFHGATVAILNEHTPKPEEISANADIIIGGANKPHIIRGDMVKDGVAVIDFGYETQGGKIVGNVVFDEVKQKASLITPVPNGVGPIGIAAALKNAAVLCSAGD